MLLIKKFIIMLNNEVLNRIARLEQLNQKFPQWNKTDEQTALQALQHLSDYDDHKSVYKQFFNNLKKHNNPKLLKKAEKFAQKKQFSFSL